MVKKTEQTINKLNFSVNISDHIVLNSTVHDIVNKVSYL